MQDVKTAARHEIEVRLREHWPHAQQVEQMAVSIDAALCEYEIPLVRFFQMLYLLPKGGICRWNKCAPGRSVTRTSASGFYRRRRSYDGRTSENRIELVSETETQMETNESAKPQTQMSPNRTRKWNIRTLQN